MRDGNYAMSNKTIDSPDSPNALAQNSGRLETTDSPRPLCNRGGRASRRSLPVVNQSKKKDVGESMPWPPAWATLPDLTTLEALSQPGGMVVQKNLFREVVDDSKAARLARILGTVPGVVTGDRIT